ncbi:hypothetical protein CRG98_000045 [Punica granatum]|uniref:Uncharacterized protein n=1 Tax=Punica granatum TaxID=22663 RepID=A0A2I0LFY6_PUNGR|nr:hypothetical protein CRG98_000045 [Punica granatum]
MAKFGLTHEFIVVYAEEDGEFDVVGGVKRSEITDKDSDYDPDKDEDYVGLEDDDYQSAAFDDLFVEAKRKLRLYRQEYLERFRENPKWSVNEMASDAQRRFAITVSKGTKYRAKAIALNMIHGSLGNNLYECFDAYILEAKSKPIIDLLEYVTRAVMRKMGGNMEMIKKWITSYAQ